MVAEMRKPSIQTHSNCALAEKKLRQAAKIGELQEVLVAAGFRSLDDQAKALGLSRSTTWTIRKATHKASGLSAATINRMLAQPRLLPLVRAKILEYVEEKNAGLYGDSSMRIRKFRPRVERE
jgi:hypothetical protein